MGALTEHFDDSELSFIVTLNDAFKEAVHVSMPTMILEL
jgi:hypothetical protein